MIARERKEIDEFFNTLWDGLEGYNPKPDDIGVDVLPDGSIRVEVGREYEAPELNLDMMNKIASFFGTTKVSKSGDFSSYGCETCDWGSRYGYTIVVGP